LCRAYHRRKKKKYYLWGVLFKCHYASTIGIWAQKVEKVNFHLVKMAPKGVIEKIKKCLKLFILFQNAYFDSDFFSILTPKKLFLGFRFL
jgi:hypothetical protein